MHYLIVLLAVWLGLAPGAQAAVYRCEDAGGNVTFADEPCGEDAREVDLPEESTTTEFTTPSTDDGKTPSEQAAPATSDQGEGEGPRRETAANAEQAPDESSASERDAAPSTSPDNPCLAAGQEHTVMQTGTPAKRVRAVCGEPAAVTTKHEIFDKTLHYRSQEREVEVFIRNGEKIGHNVR